MTDRAIPSYGHDPRVSCTVDVRRSDWNTEDGARLVALVERYGGTAEVTWADGLGISIVWALGGMSIQVVKRSAADALAQLAGLLAGTERQTDGN